MTQFLGRAHPTSPSASRATVQPETRKQRLLRLHLPSRECPLQLGYQHHGLRLALDFLLPRIHIFWRRKFPQAGIPKTILKTDPVCTLLPSWLRLKGWTWNLEAAVISEELFPLTNRGCTSHTGQIHSLKFVSTYSIGLTLPFFPLNSLAPIHKTIKPICGLYETLLDPSFLDRQKLHLFSPVTCSPAASF